MAKPSNSLRALLWVIVPFSLVTLLATFIPEWRFDGPRFDSIIDAAASVVVLTISLLVVLQHWLETREPINVMAAAFVVAAILRYLDSCADDMHRSVLLHEFCSVGLALAFASEWLSGRWAPIVRRYVIWTGLLPLLLVGILVFFFPQGAPAPFIDTTFTLHTQILNWACAALFLTAAYLCVRQPAPGRTPYFSTCVMLAIGSMLIARSELFDARWWLGQAFEIMPQLYLLTCLFIAYQRRAVRTREQLQRANEQLEAFASMASHDIKEPLRMISNYLTLLRMENEDKLDTRSQQFMAFALEGSKRLSAMTDALLDYSRVTTRHEKSEPVDLNLVLQKSLQNLTVMVQEAGAVVTSDPLPTVRSEFLILLPLFQNLLSNAIKYRRPEVEPRVHVTASNHDGAWQLDVVDNGIGFAPHDAQRIFDPFQRLHNRSKYPGSGIGLATCRKIVERHGGRIWADSVPGQGSTFHFTLGGAPR